MAIDMTKVICQPWMQLVYCSDFPPCQQHRPKWLEKRYQDAYGGTGAVNRIYLAWRGYDARVTCGACGKATHWNAVELAMMLQRRRKPLHLEAVEPLMKCKACSKRRAMVQPTEQI
ncbi:hypothetical protein [Croceicoccus marinus]|uniref:Zinc-binding domain-containing protein n=1 Tax=Croceicoccus marinus TaxID=450378 RepID=A0A7G6VYP3_9SPHN|nr:hypothetical protein [Croceicoccus marinus]QNE06858.1 hypothetical protein H4O24_17440 [Croceicoccus marinus]